MYFIKWKCNMIFIFVHTFLISTRQEINFFFSACGYSNREICTLNYFYLKNCLDIFKYFKNILPNLNRQNKKIIENFSCI